MAIRATQISQIQQSKSQPSNGQLSLADLPKGTTGRVCSLTESNTKQLQKLLVFGIIPGQNVRVIQQYPSIVVEVGHTVVAFDKKVASKVVVKPFKD